VRAGDVLLECRQREREVDGPCHVYDVRRATSQLFEDVTGKTQGGQAEIAGERDDVVQLVGSVADLTSLEGVHDAVAGVLGGLGADETVDLGR